MAGRPYIACESSQMKPAQWLERSLFTISAALLIVYVGARIGGYAQSRAQLRVFKARQAYRQAEPTANQQLAKKAVTDLSLWSPKRLEAYRRAVMSDSDTAIAVLRIPKIGLEVPVLEGTDEATLNRGVGRVIGTAHAGESGNVGIAGHRDGFFRGLKDIKAGDVVELETTIAN